MFLKWHFVREGTRHGKCMEVYTHGWILQFHALSS